MLLANTRYNSEGEVERTSCGFPSARGSRCRRALKAAQEGCATGSACWWEHIGLPHHCANQPHVPSRNGAQHPRSSVI